MYTIPLYLITVRFTRNDGAHYVLVKKNEAAGPVSERETKKTKKGKLKVDEGKFTRDNGIDSRVVSERMNIDERVISEGINGKMGRIKILMKEVEVIKGLLKRVLV
nr:hypothetical protein [Tanacetum cinerariifolium]GEZ43676.1 hypothetical protein [Tanacetum cinerariifolium]